MITRIRLTTGMVLLGILISLFAALIVNSMFYVVLGQVISLAGVILEILGSADDINPPVFLSERAGFTTGMKGEQEFNILLVDISGSKLRVIRCLRKLYIIGLREAQSLVKSTPSVIKCRVSKDEADFIITRLAECGTKAEIVIAQSPNNI